jgi:hypothetical protein
MPYGAATASSRSISSTGDISAPSKETGIPCAKPSTWRSGGRGVSNAPRDSTQASSGSESTDPSVSWPPIVTPHRPRLTE